MCHMSSFDSDCEACFPRMARATNVQQKVEEALILHGRPPTCGRHSSRYMDSGAFFQLSNSWRRPKSCCRLRRRPNSKTPPFPVTSVVLATPLDADVAPRQIFRAWQLVCSHFYHGRVAVARLGRSHSASIPNRCLSLL
ncbi:hypothetical protein Plhal703r1_c01g0005721 [Plasmopara halstedii]